MTDLTDTRVSQDLAVFVHKQLTHWMDGLDENLLAAWTAAFDALDWLDKNQLADFEVPSQSHFARGERVFLV